LLNLITEKKVVLMREYELMFIVAQRDVKEGTHEKMTEHIRGLIEKSGGRVLRVRPWGLRQLAYEINDYDYGYYVIIQLLLSADKSDALQQKIRTDERILRHIMLTTGERADDDAFEAISSANAAAAASTAPSSDKSDDKAADTEETKAPEEAQAEKPTEDSDSDNPTKTA